MITDKEASFDSSTPKDYDCYNSGVLDFIPADEKGTMCAMVTTNFREKYNNLLATYSWQLFESEKVHVKQDEGLEKYRDKYGNDIFIIDSQHLAYFLKMNRWKKEERPDDSIWMRARNMYSSSEK